jgi:hypothetical protein
MIEPAKTKLPAPRQPAPEFRREQVQLIKTTICRGERTVLSCL